MAKLSLANASVIVDAALAEARKRNMRPTTVVVVDAGGHDIALKREDGAPMLRLKMARAKAFGAVGMARGGREIRKTSETLPTIFSWYMALADGNISPALGGVLIRADGEILGAVGVTGGGGAGNSEENDEACAIAGVVAAGLQPDAGAT